MTEVVIVGGGPAGIRAAATLVDAGLRPILVDEGGQVGGQGSREVGRLRTQAPVKPIPLPVREDAQA